MLEFYCIKLPWIGGFYIIAETGLDWKDAFLAKGLTASKPTLKWDALKSALTSSAMDPLIWVGSPL